MRIDALRTLCAARGITHVDARDARAVLYRTGSREIYKVVDLRGSTTEKKLAELKKEISALR